MELSNIQNQIPPLSPNPDRERGERGFDTKTLASGVLFLLFLAFMFRNGIPHEQAMVAAPFVKKEEITEPVLFARAYLVARFASGEIFLEKEKDTPLPIASITKLFTADLFLSYFKDPLELVRFSENALRKKFSDENLSGVRAGERLKAEDVLMVMLTASANDAARAAAEATALRAFPDLSTASWEEQITAFVRLMNERAALLGLTHTHFANPEGFDDPAHYSSAEDLFLFVRTLLREKSELFLMMRRASAGVAGESGAVYRFDNTNRILTKYQKIIGSKTGATKDAKETLVLVYELFPKDPIFIALLGSENRDADAEAIIKWLESAFVQADNRVQ